MRQIVDILKVLADESRLKIVYALQKRPSCVCELSSFLDLTQPTISSHLKQLRQAGIIDYKKNGKWVEYFIVDDKDTRTLLIHLMKFVKDRESFETDISRITTVRRENLP